MNSSQVSAGGLNGKPLIVSGDQTEVMLFVGTPATVIAPLDATKRYNVFFEQAVQTDFLVYTTQDSLTKVLDGTAVFGSATTMANVAALTGFLGATPVGATGIKITATRDGSDDAGIVTSLGGARVRVRCVPTPIAPDTADTFTSGHAPAVAFA